MKNTITIIDYDNDEAEIELPASWCICGRCRGNGSYNDHAYTGEEFAEAFPTEEDVEDYLSGVYDTTCEVCNGSGKVLEVDVDRLTPDQRRLYEEDRRIKQELYAEEMAERRYLDALEGRY